MAAKWARPYQERRGRILSAFCKTIPPLKRVAPSLSFGSSNATLVWSTIPLLAWKMCCVFRRKSRSATNNKCTYCSIFKNVQLYAGLCWRATCTTIICLSLQNPNYPTILASWRRVAFVDEFFDTKNIHCKEKGHVGSKKTVEEVFSFTYSGIAACITPSIAYLI